MRAGWDTAGCWDGWRNSARKKWMLKCLHGSVTVLCFNRFIPSKTFLYYSWPNNLPYQNCQHLEERRYLSVQCWIIILRVIISFNECKREEIQRKLSVVSLVKRDFNLTFIQSQILSLILYKILLFSPQLLESNFRAAKETLMTNERIKKLILPDSYYKVTSYLSINPS